MCATEGSEPGRDRRVGEAVDEVEAIVEHVDPAEGEARRVDEPVSRSGSTFGLKPAVVPSSGATRKKGAPETPPSEITKSVEAGSNRPGETRFVANCLSGLVGGGVKRRATQRQRAATGNSTARASGLASGT